MAPLTQERAKELAETAQKICTPGKGILAADESTGTIKKRFDNINVENTEHNRAFYRELLFTAPDVEKHISGAILYEETLYQTGPGGKKMVDLLKAKDIVIGIKVDKGLVTLPFTDDENATTGMDDLAKRCAQYYKDGARFAKWRAVLKIDPAKNKPSALSIHETAHGLARYAAVCQENGLVPIVEPEILQDGTHDIRVCAKVTEDVLAACFKALHDHGVLLEGCLLKPNMVTPGSECKDRSSSDEIAFYTVRSLKRACPPALVGVTFLSGGMSEEDASLNLNAINKLGPHPFTLTFSYGRALQASTLAAWAGKPENKGKAQTVLLERARANGEAQLGKYTGGAGGDAAAASLFQKGYVY